MKEKELLLFILLKRFNSRLKIVQNRPNAKGIMDKDETENANRHSSLNAIGAAPWTDWTVTQNDLFSRVYATR